MQRKNYTARPFGTSVAEWSDANPGSAQRTDRRYSFTERVRAPSTDQSNDRIDGLRRRSSVRAASRYLWSQGRSAGREFGRQAAAMADRQLKDQYNPTPADQITKAEDIAEF